MVRGAEIKEPNTIDFKLLQLLLFDYKDSFN